MVANQYTTMTKIQNFTTNINCGSCVRSVTPFLDEVEGVTIWRVDVEDERKVLTVEGTANADAIVKMVEEAGFDIQPLG
jgi:copper chaperone CopZ